MKIFISRHGEASFNAPTDRERPLTSRGFTQTKAVIENNSSDFSVITHIWSSDLLRAKQTASVYAEKLSLKVDEKRFLSPDDELEKVLKNLITLPPNASLLIVSHQPLVGELVSVLCEGNAYQAHPFTTSEVVVIECEINEPGMGERIANYLPSE